MLLGHECCLHESMCVCAQRIPANSLHLGTHVAGNEIQRGGSHRVCWDVVACVPKVQLSTCFMVERQQGNNYKEAGNRAVLHRHETTVGSISVMEAY
jgi:hypothetical protein